LSCYDTSSFPQSAAERSHFTVAGQEHRAGRDISTITDDFLSTSKNGFSDNLNNPDPSSL